MIIANRNQLGETVDHFFKFSPSRSSYKTIMEVGPFMRDTRKYIVFYVISVYL